MQFDAPAGGMAVAHGGEGGRELRIIAGGRRELRHVAAETIDRYAHVAERVEERFFERQRVQQAGVRHAGGSVEEQRQLHGRAVRAGAGVLEHSEWARHAVFQQMTSSRFRSVT